MVDSVKEGMMLIYTILRLCRNQVSLILISCLSYNKSKLSAIKNNDVREINSNMQCKQIFVFVFVNLFIIMAKSPIGKILLTRKEYYSKAML